MIELLESWKKRDSMVSDFFAECADVPELLNSSILVVRMHLQSAVRADHDLDRVMLLNLWRTMYDYQEDALYFILCRRFDAAFAMLRLAAELARDVARMGEDRANLEMWIRKDSERDKKHYKTTFRFNQQDPIEKFLHSQYKLFSQWGVHGHMTGDLAREPVGTTADGEFLRVGITNDSVLKNLGIWGLSFFAANQMCARHFERETRDAALPVALSEFEAEAGRLFVTLAQGERNAK